MKRIPRKTKGKSSGKGNDSTERADDGSNQLRDKQNNKTSPSTTEPGTSNREQYKARPGIASVQKATESAELPMKNNDEGTPDKKGNTKGALVNEHSEAKDEADEATRKQAKDTDKNKAQVTYSDTGINNANELSRSGNVDNEGGSNQKPMSTRIAEATFAIVSKHPARVGLPPTASSGHGYQCHVCSAVLFSPLDLDAHVASHGLHGNMTLTSSEIQRHITEFISSWQNHPIVQVSADVENKKTAQLLHADTPRLVTWDAGLCTSFKIVPIVPAQVPQDVLAYTFFTSSYAIQSPFPEAAVSRIVVHTRWASNVDFDRDSSVIMAPPTENNIHLFKQLLNTETLSVRGANPLMFRANVLHMLLEFVLDNLYLNRHTGFSQDHTPFTEGANLRSLPGPDAEKWYSIMYPTRMGTPNVSKICNFVASCVRNRVGRFDRAQMMNGAMSEWVDVFETSDALTVSIRGRWMARLARMNINPTEIEWALTECAQGYVTVTSPYAPIVNRLMPYRISNAERAISQIIRIMNIGNNATVIQPVLQDISVLIQRISPLQIDPTIISNTMSTVSESTTQTLSPASSILGKLRPSNSDFSSFRVALAGWLYNGVVTTVIDDSSYPKDGGSVTSLENLWDFFILALALPLTTDPCAPVKAFMTLANMMVGFETIPMDNQIYTQSRRASAFSTPHTWPRCFMNIQLISPIDAPILRQWAEIIHRYWPNPSQIRYGAPNVFGSANLFTPPEVLLLPIDHQPANVTTPTLDFTNELTNWRARVCELMKNLVDNQRYQPGWTQSLVSSMRGTLDKLKLIKSMTPMYLQQLAPVELAVIAPMLPFPPFQVPYVRLDRDRVPTMVGVTRQSRDTITQLALSLLTTNTTVGVPLALDARAITVALLSGKYPPDLVTNVWYADAIYPMYADTEVFPNLQRDMITCEAVQTLVTLVAQISETQYPVDRYLDWIPSLRASAATAATFAESVNTSMKTAFDLSDMLLEPLLSGDPRMTQLAIQYQQYNGRTFNVIPEMPGSVIADCVQLTAEVFNHDYNLFGIARGDIIIGRVQSTHLWSPLAPPPDLVFDRDTPGVHIFGRDCRISFGMNGAAPMIRDETGMMVPFEGNWIFPLALWQMNTRYFNQQFDAWIKTGELRIRIEMGAYPYMLHYYDPRQYANAWNLTSAWLEEITPTSIPSVPFMVPTSSDHDISSAPAVQYIISTEYNDRSLFCTNSSSPQTIAGPDKHIPVERYNILTNPDAPPTQIQLPEVVDLYNVVTRYAYETPPITAVVMGVP
uniref:Major core protein lambda 1 n=1 Tax=Reovirus type 2 (strain D5/Jones) TaxID=10885 RepID=Q0Z8D0_REOVJ|nr:major core protein lambda 1 [Mammalian orthoreovirus 2]